MKDILGKDTSLLKEKKLFLFDMDGTIYRDNVLFDGTRQLLNTIRENGGNYVFITNNSSFSVNAYIDKMASFNIQTNADCFFTSTQAAIWMLRRDFPSQKIYCQGTKAMLDELTYAGIQVTSDIEDDIAAILIGFDTELTSEKLWKSCQILGRAIPYFATNPDLCCPVCFGYIPDCGSICKMLEYCTGRRPIYIGKPEAVMVDLVCEKFKRKKEETIVIGDRLYTDIAVAINAQVMSICVLTGEASLQSIKEKKDDILPTFVLNSVKDIYYALEECYGLS